MTRTICISALCMGMAFFQPAKSEAGGILGDDNRPGWLHEGEVLTSTWETYVCPGTSLQLTQDEHGHWVSADGGRYAATERQGTSASGLQQDTIECIDGDKVIVGQSGFGNARPNGFADPIPLNGGSYYVLSPEDGGDLWQSPARLAALNSDAEHGLGVWHGTWANGGTPHDAVFVQSMQGSYSLHVYDARSGLLLHAATASSSAPPNVVAQGEAAGGDTYLNNYDFVSMRDQAIPWANEPISDYIQQTRMLHFRGGQEIYGAMPMAPIPVTGDFAVTAQGTGWLEMKATIATHYAGMQPLPTLPMTMYFGRSMFMGFWAGPRALANLRQGQVLDVDPQTHMRVVVTGVNNNNVTITASNDGGGFENQYDKRTGLLVRNKYVSKLARQGLTLSLTGRE